MSKRNQPRIDLMALFGAAVRAEDFETDSLERAVANDINTVEQTVEDTQAEAQRLEKLGYSGEALQHRLGELSAGAFGRIAKAERDNDTHYRERLDELKQSIVVDKGEPSFVGELRAREIRERLANMNSEDVLHFYQQAVEQGDEEVFQAVSNAPAVYRNFDLPQELVALGEETWTERRSPAAVKRVRQVEALVQRLEKSIQAAREEISAMLGAKQVDPLAVFAKEVGAESAA